MYFLLQQAYFKGGFLLIWGILIVGVLDNFLRPYRMRHRAELPFLAIFFAILGGMEAWGTKGIILGPILLSITPSIADAYRNRFLLARTRDRERERSEGIR